MTVKFFGQFLIERGELDSAQLRDAIELMEGENRTLGELAVQDGLLSPSDASRVNAEQRGRDRPFGALAVELQLITSEHVERLVRRQQQSRLPIGEALVRLGHLREGRLGDLLDEFKIDQEPYQTGRIALPASLEGSRLAPFVVEIVPRFCLRMARIRVKVANPQPLEGGVALPYCAQVGVRGDEHLEIALAGDREFAARLAAGASGFDAETLDEWFIGDGVGEFLNVLAGNAMGALEREGRVTTLDPIRLDAEPSRGTLFELVSTDGRGALVLT